MFNKIFAALATKGGKLDQSMIDATYLKAHRTAGSSRTGAVSIPATIVAPTTFMSAICIAATVIFWPSSSSVYIPYPRTESSLATVSCFR